MENALSHTADRSTPTAGRPTRDRRLVSYIGRHGAVSIAHVMAAGGLGQTAAYDRVAALIDAGILERLDLLRDEPPLLRATRQGLRYAGLGMAPAVVSPGSVDHWLRCTSVALDLEALHGAHRVLTARELISAERHEERPIASAKIGELPDGRPRLHRPDLVILPDGHPLVHLHGDGDDLGRSVPDGGRARRTGEDDEILSSADLVSSPTAHSRTRERGREISGRDERALAGAEEMRAYGEDNGMRRALAAPIAVEVELTPKSPKRLREIVRGWRRAAWVAEVHYLCEPGQTRRAVERAVEKLHAQDRIHIEGVPSR